MGSTIVRDCLETLLLAGIQVWGLEIAEHDVKDGVRLFEGDDELLRAGECVGVPCEKVDSLMTYLREHPGFLGSDEARRVLALAGGKWQIHGLVNDVMEALGKIRGTLRQQVDPEAFSALLGTLVFLAMGRFSPEVREIYQEVGCIEGSPEQAVGYYAAAVAGRNWELARRIHILASGTEIGRIVTVAIGRRARRLFTLLVAGDRSGLADILAEIFAQIMREGENDHD